MIQLTVLMENHAKEPMESEHGLAFLVEGIHSVLFDTGASGAFARNAERLGKDLDHVDLVTLSHGHWDHTGGLGRLKGKRLLCHPKALDGKFRRRDGSTNGLAYPPVRLKQDFDCLFRKEPYWINQELLFLGEIPRRHEQEQPSEAFVNGEGRTDMMPDDSAMVMRTSEGLVLLTGCAHAGLINMLDYAMEVTHRKDFVAVVGGFHLLQWDERAKWTTDALEERGVQHLYTGHCTDDRVIEEMRRHLEMPVETLFSGMALNWEGF